MGSFMRLSRRKNFLIRVVFHFSSLIQTFVSISDFWHKLATSTHRLGKDKPLNFVRVSYEEAKRALVVCNDKLICRILLQVCQSWFLLKMRIATSTIGQIFKRSNEPNFLDQMETAVHINGAGWQQPTDGVQLTADGSSQRGQSLTNNDLQWLRD